MSSIQRPTRFGFDSHHTASVTSGWWVHVRSVMDYETTVCNPCAKYIIEFIASEREVMGDEWTKDSWQ